ncbi:unnamed protein product [Litomosoides sigmodontis]|uniref:RWD domain-containing protein n=1 Tax=Litomosoides sigmodontis TaxID=42156 RepID=A0A3P6TWX0_LITSI|nr:unnamed protein product [Litomosoides sigmodontis]
MENQNEACRRLLLDELGLLKAMYTAEELEVNEPQNPAESGQVTQLTLYQQIYGINYEVVIRLSSEYPIILKPSAFVRSSLINCDLLNQELRSFIDQKALGVPLALDMMQWINDNINRFKTKTEKQTVQVTDDAGVTDNRNYARFWIYSHHIKRRVKKRMIINTAALYQLGGLFCSGKPGVIILEGYRTDCEKFWEKIRALGWQRIVLRYCEVQANPSFFRLGKFRELQFPHVTYLTELKRLLTEAHLEYGFSLLLNL